MVASLTVGMWLPTSWLQLMSLHRWEHFIVSKSFHVWSGFLCVGQSRWQPQKTVTLALVPRWVWGTFSGRVCGDHLYLREGAGSWDLAMGLWLPCLGKAPHVLLFLFSSSGNAMLI